MNDQADLYQVKVFPENWFKGRLNNTNSRLQNVMTVWLLFGILPFLIFVVVCLPDNVLIMPGKENLGFFEDIIMLSYFIYIPALLSLAIWYFPAFSGMLQTFREVTLEHPPNPTPKTGIKVNEKDPHSLIPRVSNEKLNELFKNCEEMISGKGKVRYLITLFFIIGLTWAGYGAYKHWFVDYSYASDLFSSRYHILPFIIQTTYEFIIFGLVFPYVAFKYITILHTMRYICIELTRLESLKIRPLSPDKAGGLGSLGAYSLKMILVLLPLVVPLLLYPIFAELNELLSVGIVLFIPALCFAFLYPLSGAHTAMSKYKKQELNLLSREFNKVYDEFMRDIRDNRLSDIPADFKFMENFEKLYQKAERMPVWPFNLEILSKLGAVIAAVGIPILVQVIRILMGL